jgi:hypothetical protein
LVPVLLNKGSPPSYGTPSTFDLLVQLQGETAGCAKATKAVAGWPAAKQLDGWLSVAFVKAGRDDGERQRQMSVDRIVIELETPGDSRSLFRLRLDDKVVGEYLTAVQAHLLVGEILDLNRTGFVGGFNS